MQLFVGPVSNVHVDRKRVALFLLHAMTLVLPVVTALRKAVLSRVPGLPVEEHQKLTNNLSGCPGSVESGCLLRTLTRQLLVL
jgi:hypothetical protein